MKLGEKLQELRKVKGISQQELADKLNVSRQSVSKWELNDSLPDISKMILISEIYSISLDDLLKETNGIISRSEKKDDSTKVLFIVSTFLILFGLLSAIGGWEYEKYLESIAGGMIIQAIGITLLFIGKAISPSEVFPIKLKVVNYLILTIIPISILANLISGNTLCPYPRNLQALLLYILLYIIALVIYLITLTKQKKLHLKQTSSMQKSTSSNTTSAQGSKC